DRERSDLVIGDDAAGVADHVRVAFVQAEEPGRVQARVHAGEDCDSLGRWQWEIAVTEVGRILVGVLEQLIRDAHVSPPWERCRSALKLQKVKPTRPGVVLIRRVLARARSAGFGELLTPLRRAHPTRFGRPGKGLLLTTPLKGARAPSPAPAKLFS